MINPNVNKFIYVDVLPDCGTKDQLAFCKRRNQWFEISDFKSIKPGKRRLWLRYSIISDRYYLTSRA